MSSTNIHLFSLLASGIDKSQNFNISANMSDYTYLYEENLHTCMIQNVQTLCIFDAKQTAASLRNAY